MATENPDTEKNAEELETRYDGTACHLCNIRGRGRRTSSQAQPGVRRVWGQPGPQSETTMSDETGENGLAPEEQRISTKLVSVR